MFFCIVCKNISSLFLAVIEEEKNEAREGSIFGPSLFLILVLTENDTLSTNIGYSTNV
jgi:hypothetical protein